MIAPFKIDSVAIMLVRDDCVSLALRYDRPTFPFTWAFAGGSIENGEIWIQAAQRELLEETGLSVLQKHFKFISYAFEGGQRCAVFKVNRWLFSENPQAAEQEKHTPWQWINKKDVHCLNLMPGVERIINGIYII